MVWWGEQEANQYEFLKMNMCGGCHTMSRAVGTRQRRQQSRRIALGENQGEGVIEIALEVVFAATEAPMIRVRLDWP